MKKLYLFSLVVVVVFFTACKKGDAGPAGTPGTAGTAGTAGAAGASGPKGDTGVANIKYSDWLDVSFVISPDSSQYEGLITANGLTDSVLKTGEIKVYANFGSADTMVVHPLPYQELTSKGIIYLNPIFITGKIIITSDVNVSTVLIGSSKRFQYRYVLIPGSVKDGRAITINWNNYSEVAAYLHWKN